MSPQIALILCIIFVFFLLRLDHKQASKVSFAVWVPTIWFLLITGTLLGYWFGGSSTGGAEEGSAIDRIVLILIIIISIIIIKSRDVNVRKLLRNNWEIVLLICFMFISIIWSDMLYVSFKRWVRELVPIILAFVIASEDDPYQSLQCIIRRMIYIQIPFSFLLIYYYPHLGRLYSDTGELMWTGITTQKNGLTFLCALSLYFFAWTYITKLRSQDRFVIWYQKYIDILIVILSIWLFMGPNHSLTYSATAMAILIIGILSLVGFLWLKNRGIIINTNILTIGIVAIIIYGIVTPYLGRMTLIDFSSALNRDSTLTGRSVAWDELIPYASKKPLLGYGWGGFWTNAKQEALHFPAHNGYLETMLNTGIIGTFVFIVFLIINCRKSLQYMNNNFVFGLLWFSLLLFTVARNITESINSPTDSLVSLLIIMSILFSSKKCK